MVSIVYLPSNPGGSNIDREPTEVLCIDNYMNCSLWRVLYVYTWVIDFLLHCIHVTLTHVHVCVFLIIVFVLLIKCCFHNSCTTCICACAFIIVWDNVQFVLYESIDQTLPNKLHGPTHHKKGVTCAYNGHMFYTLLFHNITVQSTYFTSQQSV